MQIKWQQEKLLETMKQRMNAIGLFFDLEVEKYVGMLEIIPPVIRVFKEYSNIDNEGSDMSK